MPKLSKRDIAAIKSEIQSRDFDIGGKHKVKAVDLENRTVDLAFSSEEPYERYWGIEILDHKTSSVRLGRLENGGAGLVNHDWDDHVSVVENARIDKDGRGRATLRFGRSERATDILNDVADGIRTLVSVGYMVHDMVLEQKSGDVDTYRVTDWEPYEISIVSVPADTTVGVGRSAKTVQDKINPNEKEAIVPEVKEKKEVITPEAKVDTKAIETKARKDEQSRIRELTAIGSEFDCKEIADQHIDEGLDAHSMRQAVLNDMRKKNGVTGENGKQQIADVPELGMDKKDIEAFSWTRALNAMANPNDKRVQKAAAFELDVCEEAQRQSNSSSLGMMIPPDILRAKREMNVTINATGGASTVDTDLRTDSFIDLLRNQSVVNRMGAMMLTGLVGNLAFPRQNGGGTMYWLAAEGDDAPETNQSIDQVAMSPSTAGCFTSYTRQILQQSSIDIDSFIQDDLRAVMALGIDLAAIYGTGLAGQPLGLSGVTGVGAVPFAAAGAPTWEEIIALETKIAVANADAGRTQTVVNPTMRGKLKGTQKFAGTNGDPIWDGSTLNGYNTEVSNQIVAGDIIHGNWNDLMIGLWGGLDLMVDPFTKAKSGGVDVVVLQSMDIAVRNPVSFAIGQ